MSWPLFFWKDGRNNWKAKLGLACALAILVLARSLWAFLSLTAAAALLYRGDLRRIAARYPRIVWTAVGLIALAALALVTQKIVHHEGPYIGFSRFYYWLSGLKILWAHPWQGVGVGAFAAAYPLFKVGGVQNTLFAHNLFLQLAAETGIIGLAAAGWFTRGCWKTAQAGSGNARVSKDIQAVLGATLVGLVIYAQVNVFMEMHITRWTFLAILAAWVGVRRPRVGRPFDYPWCAVFIVVLTLLVPGWATMAIAHQWNSKGLRFESEKRWLDAEESFSRAIAIDPGLADGYWGLSRVYAQGYLDTGALPLLNQARTHLVKAHTLSKRPGIQADLKAMQKIFNEKRPEPAKGQAPIRNAPTALTREPT